MSVTLSILMLAAIALTGGAVFLLIKGKQRKQAGLMLLLALIMVANIAIWTIPDASGEAPLASVAE